MSVTEWIFFIAIVVVALVLYRNRALRDSILNPDHLMQQRTQKFYLGLLGVAVFILVISVIIICIWDPLFNYQNRVKRLNS